LLRIYLILPLKKLQHIASLKSNYRQYAYATPSKNAASTRAKKKSNRRRTGFIARRSTSTNAGLQVTPAMPIEPYMCVAQAYRTFFTL
jgi:hypothetical protein